MLGPRPAKHRPEECLDGTADSARLAKRQIDSLPAQQGVLAVGERRNAVKEKPGRPAPYHDIAMLQPKAAWLVAPFQPAEQEDRRQPQRNRNDRRAEIGLVLVLMQRHPGAGLIAIDQARIRREAINARSPSRL